MIEEKLKEKSTKSIIYEVSQNSVTMGEQIVVRLSDALSICKSEIAEACKKQREICARIFLGNARQPNDNMAIPELNFRISEIIKNAPSPLDEVK